MMAMATEPRAGARIRTRRQALGWTQVELAARVGVSESTVIRWEKGKMPPSRHRGRIEAVLGISLSDESPLPVRAIPPELRELVHETLNDPDDRRRVIGLLEGTLTWPREGQGEMPRRAAG